MLPFSSISLLNLHYVSEHNFHIKLRLQIWTPLGDKMQPRYLLNFAVHRNQENWKSPHKRDNPTKKARSTERKHPCPRHCQALACCGKGCWSSFCGRLFCTHYVFKDHVLTDYYLFRSVADEARSSTTDTVESPKTPFRLNLTISGKTKYINHLKGRRRLW